MPAKKIKNPEEFESLLQLLEYFKDEVSCHRYFQQMRWADTPVCPHCEHEKAHAFSDGITFKCAACRKKFTVRMGTVFESSRLPLRKWFAALYLITSHRKGISSHQLAKDLDVTQKTAWFLLHRIRHVLATGSFEQKLGSEGSQVVEIDESFVGGKNKNRHKDKKVEQSQGRAFKDKTPVIGIMERGVFEIVERPHKVIPGKTVKEKVCITNNRLWAQVIPNTQTVTLQGIIEREVEPGCIVITDEWQGYKYVRNDYHHYNVNHAAKVYSLGDGMHSNTIENSWSSLKRSIIGIYHKTSRKHLQAYVNEFTHRLNFRLLSNRETINCVLSDCAGRLTYKALIQKEIA